MSADSNVVEIGYHYDTGVRRSQRQVMQAWMQENKKRTDTGNTTQKAVEQQQRLYHEKDGKFIGFDGKRYSLCDCLNPECLGCHFPCPKCSSLLCGSECQRGRRNYCLEIRTDGHPRLVVSHPYIKPRI